MIRRSFWGSIRAWVKRVGNWAKFASNGERLPLREIVVGTWAL